MGSPPIIRNHLSIDVEDYFQVSAFEGVSPPEQWDQCELRVEHNTDRVLQCLEVAGVQATFFVLGWVARRCPALIRRIAAQGHEIASHGFSHRRLPQLTRSQFREEVRDSKALLEDLAGQPVVGYRAPSFSIGRETLWAFDELAEAGYRYDSSVFPICHDFYGMADWPDVPGWLQRQPDGDWCPVSGEPSPEKGPRLLELPIPVLRLAGARLPIAGGGYFRLYPYAFTRWGLQRLNRQEQRPFVFYLHPWELDPQQPRMAGAGVKSRLRHYLNLGRTEGRLRRLLAEFVFSPLRDALPPHPLPDTASTRLAAAAESAQVKAGHAYTSG